MMNGMMNGSGMGWMMGGMTIGWLLGITVLILAVFALIKYLRSK
jgi:hypothetical protein